MATAFQDSIQSPQFTFFVGQEAEPIVVHAAMIAATSEQLGALMNGGMEESESGIAKLEDVRMDDFIRFCEYAYRGDYTVPAWEQVTVEPRPVSSKELRNGDDAFTKPKKKNRSEEEREPDFPQRTITPLWAHRGSHVAFGETFFPWQTMASPGVGSLYEEPEPGVFAETPSDEEGSEYVPAPEPVHEVERPSRTAVRTRFNSRSYLPRDNPRALIQRKFEPKPNSAATQNFTPVLLAHARLYSFAHLRMVTPLKALTLDKLHKTLMDFKLFISRVGDIIELARCAYSNPDLPDRRDDGGMDELKELIVEYIVCKIDTIGGSEEFVRFLEEGTEFAGDFWKMVRGYVG